MDNSSAARPAALRALATALVLFATRPAAAFEIYKSYDAQGHVVYSDQRDPNTPETVISDDSLTIPLAGTVLDAPMQASEPPPPLPEEVPPAQTDNGAVWTPGYWVWNGGYYWVPGMWIVPPRGGLVWTPGYWEYGGRVFAFRRGYWGPHLGFYGGVNYGNGYPGVTSARTSFNGGPGGLHAAPTAAQIAAAAETHVPLVAKQREIAQQSVRGQTYVAAAKAPPTSYSATASSPSALRPAVTSSQAQAANAMRAASYAANQEARAARPAQRSPEMPSRTLPTPAPARAILPPRPAALPSHSTPSRSASSHPTP
jgi:hypothetical protein